MGSVFSPPTSNSSKAHWVGYLLSIAAISFLIIHLSFLLYKKLNTAQIEEIIPVSSALAVELQYSDSLLQSVRSSQALRHLCQIPEIRDQVQFLNILDSLSRSISFLKNTLEEKPFFVSIHPHSTRDFDLVYYLPLFDFPKRGDWLNSVIEKSTFLTETRTYEAKQITVFKDSLKTPIWNSTVMKDWLVVSKNSSLVEDAIRHFTAGERNELIQQLKTDNELEETVKIYVNPQLSGKLLSCFLKKGSDLPSWISQLAPSSQINALSTGGFTAFRGQYFGDDNDGNILETLFDNHPPTDPASSFQLIPDKASFFVRLGFENGEKLHENLLEWQESNQPHFQALQQATDSKIRAGISKLSELISEEIIFFELEEENKLAPSQLLLLQSSQEEELLELLFELDLKLRPEESLPFIEKYGAYQIKSITIKNLPQLLGVPLQSNWPETFYAFYQKHLILAESPQQIKNVLEMYERNQILGELKGYRDYLSANLNEKSNLAIGMLPQNAWEGFVKQLKPQWKPFFESYKRYFLKFGFAWTSWNSSRGEKHHTGLVSFRPSRAQPFQQKLWSAPLSTNAQENIHLLKDHFTGKTDILLQDKWNNLYLFGSDGKLLFKSKMFGKINTEVNQIDLKHNGNLQILISYANKIHLIDRKGRFAKGYPLSLPTYFDIEHLSVATYNNFKNYRYLATGKLGNAFAISQYGTPLYNWNPRMFSNLFADAAKAVRIGDFDAYLFLLKNGTLNALKPDAKSYPEFPLIFDVPTSNPLFVIPQQDFESTQLQLLGTSGELISCNMKGKVLLRKQLPKKYPGSRFTMCIDQHEGKSWVAARKEGRELTFIMPQGGYIFRKYLAKGVESNVSYFKFGAHNELFAVHDLTNKKLNLFYNTGESVLDSALDAEQVGGIEYLEKDDLYLVYLANGKNLEAIAVKNR